MQQKNSMMVWVIVVIVVVIAIIGFSMWNKSPVTPDQTNDQTATTTVDTTTPDQTPGTLDTSGTVNAGPVTLSYADALALYKDKRIQINSMCQASSNANTFKNGTKIMIDNRSAIAHTLKVGSTFTIKPYGFRIVTLSSTTLPATWLVDCDAHQNITTLTIQK